MSAANNAGLKTRATKRRCAIIALLTFLLPVLAFKASVYWLPYRQPNLSPPQSTLVLDRDGQPLFASVAFDGQWRIPLDADAINPDLLNAIIAVEDAAGMDTHPIEYDYIPRATFCYPQVASFGLTEKQAKEAGHDVVIGKIPMGAVGAGTVYGDRGGQIKIVGDKQYGELLGAHIVGVKAADMLQELVVAHDLEGGYPEVARSVHAHPTFSEAVMEAARAADGWLIHG